MDISGIELADFGTSALNRVTGDKGITTSNNIGKADEGAFSKVLSSAMDLIKETNSLSDAAEEAEISFAMGQTDSIHDVTVAQQKAYVSLQYTVAIKNAVLSAYRELMQIQI